MTSRWRGEWYEGQSAEFTGRSGNVVSGLLTDFSGKHCTLRTTDGKTWRVPARLLRASAVVLDSRAKVALVAAEQARKDVCASKRDAATEEAHATLAPRAAEFRRGMTVDVVHRGRWGWTATVVRVDGGKVTVTNPTRGLFDRAEAFGLDAHRGRRTTATVTLWANRVRLPGSPRDDLFTLFGF